MHSECTANAPCPTCPRCPTCPGRQTQNWGPTRPTRQGPAAQWPWPRQSWSWKKKEIRKKRKKRNLGQNSDEFRMFLSTKVSIKAWTKVSKGVQRFPSYWNDQRKKGEHFTMFQVHGSLHSRRSLSPQRYTKYLKRLSLAETLAHPEIPLTLENTLVQIRQQHAAGPLKALFANGKKRRPCWAATEPKSECWPIGHKWPHS